MGGLLPTLPQGIFSNNSLWGNRLGKRVGFLIFSAPKWLKVKPVTSGILKYCIKIWFCYAVSGVEMSLLSQVRFYIPAGQAVPPEIVKKYQAAYYAAARKASGHRRKAVGTIKAYQEKVARPLMRGLASIFKPDFVSQTGLTAEEVIKGHAQSTRAAGRQYLDKLAQAYKKVNGVPAKLIKDKLATAGERWAQEMAYACWPLTGGPVPGAKGPVVKAQLWLVGDQSVLNYLTEQDEVLLGAPVLITESTQRGIFKTRLNRRLIQAGMKIIELLTNWPMILKKENDQTNALVQRFARSEFAPFTSGGPSHLDFIVREIPDPKNPTRLIKQLYLEVQVAKN